IKGIELYFQCPMCRSISVRTGNSWFLRIRIRFASLEPLISGFLILAGRFGFAIYFGRRSDNRM
ncbi:hypothetical protein, partial [Alistipes putredinis]|uniref:hypothetical protein n=1 Tax=Alistipes putredinis TaxID=28117 RepID=UPI003A94196C